MIRKIIHLILAILFLPVCFAVAIMFYEQVGSVNILSKEQIYFFYGCVFYLIFHTVIFKPDRVYVFGHEMMHAIAAILSGGRVSSFKVSKNSGSVKTNKSNTFICLAPYLVPFYTILIIAAYFIWLQFNKEASSYLKPFLFLVGFTLAFHIVLTIDILKIKQTDLIGTGYLFSMELIYFVNMLVIAFIFSLLFKEIQYSRFINSVLAQSEHNYITLFRQLFL